MGWVFGVGPVARRASPILSGISEASKNPTCAFGRIGFDGGVGGGGRRRPEAIDPPPAPPLAGLRYADVLAKHLAKLRRAYAHGNRRLFYDDVVTAYLLAFFNPTARSLRAI